MTSNQGTYWPGWETTRLIGRGSFGAVYEIQREIRGRTEHAALKVISIPHNESEIHELRADGYDNESITQYFADSLEKIEEEYAMMADLKGHSNVVYCDDIRTVQHDDGFGWDIYIKMELLTPLKSFLSDKVTDAQVIKLGMDICDALKLCEDLNIVHRDIKPENIFVSRNGNYKLGDFGIAKTMEGTTGGTKTGTYDYMSPEVYNNLPYHTQTDIYSLGLVMYWLLNNRTAPFLPTKGKKPTPSEKSIARDRRFSGERILTPLYGSKQLQEIVLKACAFDPRERYQSARKMREDLMRLSGGYAAELEQSLIPVPDNGGDSDEYTVGPVFNPATVTETESFDQTVGPIFNPASATNTEDIDCTVGPVIKGEIDKAVDQKETTEKKTRSQSYGYWGLAVAILACIICFICIVDFNTQKTKNVSEETRIIEWVDEIEQYRATHKTYTLTELIALTENMSLSNYSCWESLTFSNVIIRKYNGKEYTSIQAIYLDAVDGEVVYGDDFTFRVDGKINADSPTYSYWVNDLYEKDVHAITSSNNTEYYWYATSNPDLNLYYDTIYISYYIEGYATESFISKGLYDTMGLYANEASQNSSFIEQIKNERGEVIKVIYHTSDGQIRSWVESEYDNTGKEIRRSLFDANGELLASAFYDGSNKLSFYVAHEGDYSLWSFNSDWKVTYSENYDDAGNQYGTAVINYDEYGNRIESRSTYEGTTSSTVYIHEYDIQDHLVKTYNDDGSWIEYEYSHDYKVWTGTHYDPQGTVDYYTNVDSRVPGMYRSTVRDASGTVSNVQEEIFDDEGRVCLAVVYNADGTVACVTMLLYYFDQNTALLISVYP